MKPSEFDVPKRLLGRNGVTVSLAARAFKFLNALRNIEVKSTGRDKVSYSDSGILLEVKGGGAGGGGAGGGGAGGGGAGHRYFRAALDPSGIIPTIAEVTSALESVYDPEDEPQIGDQIGLVSQITGGSHQVAEKLYYELLPVLSPGSNTKLLDFIFSFRGVTLRALGTQRGIW